MQALSQQISKDIVNAVKRASTKVGGIAGTSGTYGGDTAVLERELKLIIA